MTILIDQFMWPFQHTFRRFVQSEIQDILSQVGLETRNSAKVLLVGLATKKDLHHAICIEPEDGPLVVDDLQAVTKKTAKLFESDPESSWTISSPRHHDRRQRETFLRCRAQAIAETIQESGKFEGLTFFASNSAPLAGYEIHTCVGIPRPALESVPRFNSPAKDEPYGHIIEESFAQAIINTCLARADRALRLPNPGEDIYVLGDRVDIVRLSADRFVRNVAFALTLMPRDVFRCVSDVSKLTYERSGAKGHLVLSERSKLTSRLEVTFQSPVGLNDAKTVRKMLELTDDKTSLLTDGEVIYGLGKCISAPDVARIRIEKHAEWSLSIDDMELIRVSYEHATLPKQILDKGLFNDVARRTVGVTDIERIWNIFQHVLGSGHGTTIVVSEDPASEIERLGKEALAIKPEYLDYKDVMRLGGIDGAVLLGPDGRCHAFGVILDGLATTSGDRARGSRFNSAVRYQRTSSVGTVVIVISDDGTVNLIPKLMPQVSRKEVEDAVRAFCVYSALKDSSSEEWARRNERVKDFEFYLNEEQCDRVNNAYEEEMNSRLTSGQVVVSRRPLQPSPDMDESFFTED